jgi:hypothetical protein
MYIAMHINSFKENRDPQGLGSKRPVTFQSTSDTAKIQQYSGSSSDSDSSALSASNWRRSERLIREVVKDRGDKRALQGRGWVRLAGQAAAMS